MSSGTSSKQDFSSIGEDARPGGSDEWKVRPWKLVFSGMKSWFGRKQSDPVEPHSVCASMDQESKSSDESDDRAIGEAKDMALGIVFQTLKQLLSSADVGLALLFLDHLTVCGMADARVSWKRELFEEAVSDFVQCNNEKISIQLALELLCAKTIPRAKRLQTHASASGSSEFATQRVPGGLTVSLAMGRSDATCPKGEGLSDDTLNNRVASKRSVSAVSHASSSRDSAGLAYEVAERSSSNLRFQRCSSGDSASSSEVLFLDASPPRRRSRPSSKPSPVRTPGSSARERGSHNQERNNRISARSSPVLEQGSHHEGRGRGGSRRGAARGPRRDIPLAADDLRGKTVCLRGQHLRMTTPTSTGRSRVSYSSTMWIEFCNSSDRSELRSPGLLIKRFFGT